MESQGIRFRIGRGSRRRPVKQRKHGRYRWAPWLLLGLALAGTTNATPNIAIPPADGLYTVANGAITRLEPTSILLPILRDTAQGDVTQGDNENERSIDESAKEFEAFVNSNNTSLGPPSALGTTAVVRSKPASGYLPRVRLDSFGGLDIFVRSAPSQLLSLRCVSLINLDYLGQETNAPLLEVAGSPGTYRTRCHFRPETMLIHMTLNNGARSHSRYVVAMEDPQRIYAELMSSSDLSLQSRLRVARMAFADAPANAEAANFLANLAPFERTIRNGSLQRLLGLSPSEYRTEESYRFERAMRNGIVDSGYSLKDYLKDYPLGRFVDQVRLEIPRRRRDHFLVEPRWFERRAETILRQILRWADGAEKASALEQYIVAYPDGRFTVSVKSEIDRLRRFGHTKVVAGATR